MKKEDIEILKSQNELYQEMVEDLRYDKAMYKQRLEEIQQRKEKNIEAWKGLGQYGLLIAGMWVGWHILYYLADLVR